MSNEEETAIIDRDYKDIGAAANAITYQAIYAPTLKEGDRPRLLGIQWFMGDLTDFQMAATKSFALQAGYALERIYLLHSLEARRREIESADARLSRMKQIIANIESLGVAFHDLKNKMIPAAAFYRRLVKAGKIPEKDEERARTTIERRVEVVMNGLKESQLKITELQGHLPSAAVTHSTLILSNVNLAAALIQASSQPQLSNVYDYYLGATFPTPEERALINASFESLNSLSELSTLTGDLESVYEQTNRIFTAILGHLNEVLPQLEEYAAFPLNEIERLANDENEDAKTRGAADVILKSISKMPQEIERLNNILGDMAAVEEAKDVNLRQLVAEALDEVRAECETHGITLESKLAGLAEPVLIHTKLDALKNFVITEVLRNAVKYMPGDKDVKKITIWAEFKDGNVLLYIQDTGRGMSPEFVQTQLFRKIGAMETLAGEDAANISRSGYGLYSAQQLMRDLGGDLYVDDEHTAAGKGSTFVIRHPLAHAVPAESGSELTVAARGLGQAMINTILPIKDIAPDIISDKALILYADDILERGAAGDLAYTLTNSQVLDNSTIVIYGRNPVRARLLERMISEAAGDKNINIVRIETEDLRGYNGFEQINAIYPDEAKELDTLLARLAAHHKISNGSILGAIKGMTSDTSIQAIKELSVERRLPVVSFEDDKGIYSFKNALSELIAISRDDKPPANREWYRTLKPIEKENIERAYQDYRRALEVAINA
jgi:signal transduction histidine kinase